MGRWLRVKNRFFSFLFSFSSFGKEGRKFRSELNIFGVSSVEDVYGRFRMLWFGKIFLYAKRSWQNHRNTTNTRGMEGALTTSEFGYTLSGTPLDSYLTFKYILCPLHFNTFMNSLFLLPSPCVYIFDKTRAISYYKPPLYAPTLTYSIQNYTIIFNPISFEILCVLSSHAALTYLTFSSSICREKMYEWNRVNLTQTLHPPRKYR